MRLHVPAVTTKRTFRLFLAFAAAATISGSAAAANSTLKLTFDKPASRWTEALPVGNGRLGAMVFGGSSDEHLQINESTLWGGGPHSYTSPQAYSHLPEVRQLIFDGKLGEAEKLSETLMGSPKLLMPYQPFCDMRLHFTGHEQTTEYQRELDLNDAVSVTHYKVGEVTYRREIFASYPDQVLAVRLTATGSHRLSFSVALDSPQPGTQVEATGDTTLQLTGQIQPRQNSRRSWTGSWDQPGMKFAAVLKVLAEGGSVHNAQGHLDISDATAVTILFSNATSFKTYRDISGNSLTIATGYLQHASQYSYPQLLARHLHDYQALFSRVRLSLGDDHSTATTDRRIRDFAQNEDPALLALYFEFGRYLLISSSRPGGQPANLQGIWNQDMKPAWGSKFTTNINLQMNYWQADAGDLWETEEPLWDLVRDLLVTGSETARDQYQAKGWVLHHNTDIWRATAPVDGPWGIWPSGSFWLANQMWEHYLFSDDRTFLRERGYPAMKAAAEFALTDLVEAPNGTPFAGRLVTNPSTSPENQYILNGGHYSLTYAPTMDIELIRELFQNCRRAADILGTEASFKDELAKSEARLPPVQIGQRGQLQEWIQDYAEVEPAHRHVSHLWALYPGHSISLQSTPDLAAAAKRSLELRGDGGTGWSTVWRTGLWARLKNAEHAYANLKILITTSTLPDMFDLCPPFQIDGNLGGPAAISEMLIQSTSEAVTILPALPQQWPVGNLNGVRIHGQAKVDIAWKDGRLTGCTLTADRPRKYRVTYGQYAVDVVLKPGQPVSLDGYLHPTS